MQKGRMRNACEVVVRTAKKPFAMLEIRGLLDRNRIEEALQVQAAAGLSNNTMIRQIDAAARRSHPNNIGATHPLFSVYFQTDQRVRLQGFKARLSEERCD
ncbi:Uncharacterised protein [Candidatus Bilamarchaeum dharawalense]|uniref:Uncharacterized protein n=1 Tax=Candidatus Bilamarchaeum dharawalense TaxID=2885759 RepID=A0A5E4LQI7_9ARCH|nr:Uncharacterised protein [Candidatus Bilamarchaeum dharawalense]